MSLPTAADYQGAIQNPHQCFSDFELRFGSPLEGNWGLPKTATGNFAAVFQVTNSGRKYAVKCFTRYHPDQEERYAAISAHLERTKLPHIVGFWFLKHGILVKGKWHPVLKMEWVEGDTLGAYVDKNINNSHALQELAKNFLELVASLRHNSIAHGDLQHGNIIVVGNSLRLVDYDGMYVPGLEGKLANEVGHPNYQHPARDKHFGPFLDEFSVWVIYLSLVALCADPSLRSRLRLDEECLVFRRKDFSAPESSEALRALEQSPDQNIRSLTMSFRALVYAQDLTNLPSLSGLPATKSSSLPTHAPTANWISDHVGVSKAEAPASVDPMEVGTSWIWDHLQPVNPITIKASYTPERLVIGFFSILTLLILVMSGAFLWSWRSAELWLLSTVAMGTAVSLTCGLGAVGSFLIARYRMQPEFKEKALLIKEYKSLKEQVSRLTGSKGLKQLTESVKQLEKQEEKDISSLLARQQESVRKENAEIAKIETELKTLLSQLTVRQTQIQSAERSELARALDDQQRFHVRMHLEQHTVIGASISGIGDKLKQRLFFAGIRTAADVRPDIHVSGIGPVKASALQAWRQFLEFEIRNRMPKALPPQQEESIKLKYRSQLNGLRSDQVKAVHDSEQAKKAVHLKYSQDHSSLSKAVQDTRSRYSIRRQEVDLKTTNTKRQLSEKIWLLSKTKRTLDAYRRIDFATYLRRVVIDS